MTVRYTNYRWEPINKRKGDRYAYKRDVTYDHMPWRLPEHQVIANVTYDSRTHSPYWGKWHVTVHALSPALNVLRTSDIPKFSNKADAIAWVTAMVGFSL